MAYRMETLSKLAGKLAGPMKNGAKWSAIAAGTVAAVYAAGSIVGAIRSSREYKEPDRMPEPEMDPYMMAGPQNMMDQQTMMGMAPVEGAHAQRVLASRGQGMAAGVNAASPQMEQDGRSTVDGRPVQDLGGIGM